MQEFNLDIEKYAYPDLNPLEQDYRWAHKYCYDIVKGNIPAGKIMINAAKRHFMDLERDDMYFDIVAAKSIVAFFKFVPITDGKLAGKPTILLPWQIWVVCSLIAWRWSYSTFDDDGNAITTADARRFNQSFILVSRKAGKTTLAAGIMLYLMIKSGFQPRAFSLSTKKDAAKLLWNTAKVMIKLSPRLREQFEPRANDILMPAKEGMFKALASDSGSLDGLNPITASLDECHAIKDRNLYGVIVSAFGAQPEYLMLCITTAGFILDGLCTDLYKNGVRVLDPEEDVTQDNYFYAMWQIDADDDWDDPQAWYKANAGTIYGLPPMKYLKDRHKEAEMSAPERANFLTKHCNLFVSGAQKWLDMDEVRSCRVKGMDFEEFVNKDLYVALDRSNLHDVTSFCFCFPDEVGGADFFFKNYLPRSTVNNATDYLKSIYFKAEAEDDLELLETMTIRDNVLTDFIMWIVATFPNLKMIGYDPYKMKEIAEDLEPLGVPLVSVGQTIGNMSEPAKKIEGLIKEGMIRYDSVLFEFACSCAVIGTTKFGNVAVYKENDKTEKIDPLIAGIIAVSCATLVSVDDSIYDHREVLMV